MKARSEGGCGPSKGAGVRGVVKLDRCAAEIKMKAELKDGCGPSYEC